MIVMNVRLEGDLIYVDVPGIGAYVDKMTKPDFVVGDTPKERGHYRRMWRSSEIVRVYMKVQRTIMHEIWGEEWPFKCMLFRRLWYVRILTDDC